MSVVLYSRVFRIHISLFADPAREALAEEKGRPLEGPQYGQYSNYIRSHKIRALKEYEAVYI